MSATAMDVIRALADDHQHRRQRAPAPWTGPTAEEVYELDRRIREEDDLERRTPWEVVPNPPPGRPREVVCEALNLETGKREAVFMCVGGGR